MAKIDKLLEQAGPHLDEGESVLSAVEGAYEVERLGADSVRRGVLLATETRLVFYAKKLTGFDLESFPYKTVSSFERGKNINGGILKFHASGNSVSVKWIRSPNLDEFVTMVKGRIDEAHTASSAPATAAAPDPADQLRKLGELRDAGLLSEDEFAQKKQQLLDRM